MWGYPAGNVLSGIQEYPYFNEASESKRLAYGYVQKFNQEAFEQAYWDFQFEKRKAEAVEKYDFVVE